MDTRSDIKKEAAKSSPDEILPPDGVRTETHSNIRNLSQQEAKCASRATGIDTDQ